MESSSVVDGFEKALDQANKEFESLYRHKMSYIKKVEDRVVAAKMIMMRARDIEKEKATTTKRLFTFTITTFDPENRKWDKCPGCGDPDINKESGGHPWQGCYKCEVLLGSNGTIKAMDPTRGKGGK